MKKFVINSSIEATIDNTVDPYIELAIPEVVDRIGEEAIEIIVIDSITETIIDKIIMMKMNVPELSQHTMTVRTWCRRLKTGLASSYVRDQEQLKLSHQHP